MHFNAIDFAVKLGRRAKSLVRVSLLKCCCSLANCDLQVSQVAAAVAGAATKQASGLTQTRRTISVCTREIRMVSWPDEARVSLLVHVRRPAGLVTVCDKKQQQQQKDDCREAVTK